MHALYLTSSFDDGTEYKVPPDYLLPSLSEPRPTGIAVLVFREQFMPVMNNTTAEPPSEMHQG